MTRSCLRAIALVFVLTALLQAAPAQTSPEFSLALSPATVSLPQGAVTSFTLTIESTETAMFAISLVGLPDGVQAEAPVMQPGMGTVVLNASSTATVGSFAVQVKARTGNNSQTQILTLNIKPLQPAPQWEYTAVATGSDDEFLSLANSLGEQGWELVSVRFREQATNAFVGFFKRIKR